jgi:hypothetical protein
MQEGMLYSTIDDLVRVWLTQLDPSSHAARQGYVIVEYEAHWTEVEKSIEDGDGRWLEWDMSACIVVFHLCVHTAANASKSTLGFYNWTLWPRFLHQSSEDGISLFVDCKDDTSAHLP